MIFMYNPDLKLLKGIIPMNKNLFIKYKVKLLIKIKNEVIYNLDGLYKKENCDQQIVKNIS